MFMNIRIIRNRDTHVHCGFYLAKVSHSSLANTSGSHTF